MLTHIEGLPAYVVGIKATGDVTAEDYRSVFVPEVEARSATQSRLRLLYVLGPEFEGFTGGAAWEDAKVGMRHFATFERMAVVTDHDWLARMIRGFGLLLPGEVRVFATADSEAARAWVAEAPSPGKLDYELREDSGLLILRPHGELEAGDFERISASVDPFLDRAGRLSGLVVVAADFPGWDSLMSLLLHVRFIRDHHARIARVAIATSSRFLAAVPRLAGVFLDSEVRQFGYDDQDAAIAWAAAGD